jgi:predicted ATPase
MLLESELLQEEAEQYVLTGSLSEATIPATLQDSLMARLDRLPKVKEVAQLGAVLGREFGYEMLQALTVLEEGTLQQGLKQLVDHELLYQRGHIPRAKYIFRHALIRDTAYQSLLRRTRQHYHQQVAQLLEARFPEVVETQPELVAHHYTEAGVMASAVPYWQQAGQRAIERSANAEAIAHLRQGLAGLTTLPETPERLQQELDLQAPLSQALRLTKGMGHPEVKQACDRALELCQRMGDSPQLFRILRGLISYYRVQGLLQTGRQLEEQLLRSAQAQSDPEPLILAHLSLGQNMYLQGELTQAQAHHDEALTIYHAQEDRTLGVSSSTQFGVSSQFWLARELWCLGYPDRALRHVREALALAQTVSHPYTSSWALYRAAMENQHLRDASVAQAYATDTKRLASEHGFAEWLARASAVHGWALAMQGQSEQGIAELRQGIDAEQNQKSFQPYLLGLLAEAYGESGHAEKGLPPLAEAIDLMDTLGLRIYGAELHLLKGKLLLKQAVPNISEAETCFHDALERARAQQAKAWELRAATSLARLWQSQNKRQEAYDLLAPVYEWFTEGFDTADLQEAKALLAELSA